MKKFVVLSLVASAALGLSACGSTTNNSADVVANADDTNLTAMDDGNMTADTNAVDANAAAPVTNAQ